MENEIYTVEQVAARLQINPATIYRLIKAKRFPHTNISNGEKRKIYRITESQLQEYLKTNSNGQ